MVELSLVLSFEQYYWVPVLCDHCVKCCSGFKNKTKEILPPTNRYSRKYIMNEDVLAALMKVI